MISHRTPGPCVSSSHALLGPSHSVDRTSQCKTSCSAVTSVDQVRKNLRLVRVSVSTIDGE